MGVLVATLVQDFDRLSDVHVIEAGSLLRLLDDLSQFDNLFFVLLKQGIFGIHVDSGLVFDILSPGRISQGGDSFFEVIVGGRDTSYHDGFGVAS